MEARSCGCLSELRRRSPWPAGWRLRRPRLAQDAQQPGVWVSKDGTRTTIVGAGGRAGRRPGGRRWCGTWRSLQGRGAQLGVSVRDVGCRAGQDARAAPSSTTCATDSAAEKAGIKKGDVITEFDGERVRGVRHLTRLVTETPEGRTVKATRAARGQARGPVGDARQRQHGPHGARQGFECRVPPMRFERCRGDMILADAGGAAVLLRHACRPPTATSRSSAWTDRAAWGSKIQELTAQLGEYFGTPRTACSSTASRPTRRPPKAGLKAGDVDHRDQRQGGRRAVRADRGVQARRGRRDAHDRLHARQEGAVGQGDARRRQEPRGAAAETAERQPDLTVERESCATP